MCNILFSSGFKHSVCDRGFYNGPVTKFWAYAFVLSKVPELGKSMVVKMYFDIPSSFFYSLVFKDIVFPKIYGEGNASISESEVDDF